MDVLMHFLRLTAHAFDRIELSSALGIRIMKDRIQLLIENEGLTPAKIADLMQVQRSSVSHILAGRNKPSMDFLNKLMHSFPNINGHWLLTGLGEMYLDGAITNAPIIEQKDTRTSLFDESPKKNTIPSSLQDVEPEQILTNRIKPNKVIKKIIVIYDDFTSEEIFNA